MKLKQTAAALAATALTMPFAVFAADGAGPSAGDLSALTPDTGSILVAIAAVAGGLLAINLAIKGVRTVMALIGKR